VHDVIPGIYIAVLMLLFYPSTLLQMLGMTLYKGLTLHSKNHELTLDKLRFPLHILY
jgi:hypothetical protein